MEVQTFSLDELIDEATDINNLASNESQALAVANQVNRTIGGPNTAVRLLISKLHQRQEVVTLQVLMVLEVCVKNCGVKFHNEIGKYKFINELIKLLSSKYDGDITPPSVKERVVSLLYSWYVGLPQETKIGEAYKMLKQQGIVKRDPIDQNGGVAYKREHENTAFQDEGNTQLLKTLLSSNDAEDLHSANKLIKNMVKEEEERLDRVSKRIQFLETVSNNVKLLDEMLEKFDANTEGSNLEIMNDLYERCVNLRPELFRLASKNVDDKDDSVAEILSSSDELTRVIDLYKEKVLFKKSSLHLDPKPFNSESQNSSFTTSLLDLDIASPSQDTSSNILLSEQFKMLGLEGTAMESSQPANGNMLVYSGMQNNLQNQMSDNSSTLFQGSQFDPMVAPMVTNKEFVSGHNMPCINSTATPLNMSSMNSSMIRPPSNMVPGSVPKLENANADKSKPKDPFDFDIFNSFNSSSDFLKPTNEIVKDHGLDKNEVSNGSKVTEELLSLDEPSQEITVLDSQPIAPKQDIGNNRIFPATNILPSSSPQTDLINTTTVPVGNVPPLIPPQNYAPASLATSLNVSPINPPRTIATALNVTNGNCPTISTAQSNALHNTSPAIADNTVGSIIQPTAPPVVVTNISASMQNVSSLAVHTPLAPSSNPIESAQPAVNYLVPLEALKPSKYAPIPILDKDGIKTFLIIAEDTRENANANVIVNILSTISLNTEAVKDFSIQVAVPKVMRVKLQPATTSEMPPFNPVLPPPSISQIMLIANPTKDVVRLRFKMIYNIAGVSHVETISIDQLPVS